MYNLVLEARPGEFMPIDINILLDSKEKYSYFDIRSIDAFTKRFTKEELLQLIKESNSVPDYYLNGQLKIVNEKKYRFEILTKEIDYSLDDFFIKYIDDKKIMNKFLNIYMKNSNDLLNIIKRGLKDKNIALIMEAVSKLEYVKIRNIYFYLYHNVIFDK